MLLDKTVEEFEDIFKKEYYWEGSITILPICTPAFYPEQHKEIK